MSTLGHILPGISSAVRGGASPIPSPSTVEEPIILQGPLFKRGRRKLSLWRTRYFVLRASTFSYQIQEGLAERRVIPLTRNSAVIREPDVHALAFSVHTPGVHVKITCRAQSEEEVSVWISAIQGCIENSPAWPVKIVLAGRNDVARAKLMENYLSAVDSLNGSKASARSELGTAEVQLHIGDKNNWVRLAVWDTLGGAEFAKLRGLAYPNSDAVLIVFSDPDSFAHVEAFSREARGLAGPKAHIVLVGCGQTRISTFQAEELVLALDLAGFFAVERPDSAEEVLGLFNYALKLAVPELSSKSSTPTASGPRAVFFDKGEDSDEGSLIDREEEALEDLDQVADVDFSQEDPAYLSRLLHRRVADRPALAGIAEQPDEPGELQAEIQELRQLAARKDAEMDRMRKAMASLQLKKHNVEVQLAEMKKEMGALDAFRGDALRDEAQDKASPLKRTLSKGKIRLNKASSTLF